MWYMTGKVFSPVTKKKLYDSVDAGSGQNVKLWSYEPIFY